MRKIVLLLSILALALCGCKEVDDNRVPPIPANLMFNNAGLWNTFGVSGYGQFRYFDKEKGIPANYGYKATDYTGFGGVLLIYGMEGPLAYDRACPVEARKDAVLSIDQNNFEAVCGKCGSRFNVCEAYGAPVEGEALDKQFGLRRLSVVPSGGGYIITTRIY